VKLAAGLAAGVAGLACPALAQQMTLDLRGRGQSLSLRSVQLLLLITVLSIVPGLAVMVTCFPFIVTVLSILRQALGLQQAPPNMLIISLALFLTWYVMDPVFTEAWVKGIEPMTNGAMEVGPGLQAAIEPFRVFMARGSIPRRCRRCRTCGRLPRHPEPRRRCRFWCRRSCCRKSSGPSRSAS
jgi:flagellar biosynthesis protein FliP